MTEQSIIASLLDKGFSKLGVNIYGGRFQAQALPKCTVIVYIRNNSIDIHINDTLQLFAKIVESSSDIDYFINKAIVTQVLERDIEEQLGNSGFSRVNANCWKFVGSRVFEESGNIYEFRGEIVIALHIKVIHISVDDRYMGQFEKGDWLSISEHIKKCCMEGVFGIREVGRGVWEK